MAKLSKREIAQHRSAEQLLTLDRLNDDQREFVLRHWNEGAEHMNGAAGAFFTPYELALDCALMGGCNGPPDGYRVLDLCAGIGTLGLACWWRSNKTASVTCVEINPDYVAVGRRLFPEARWIEASADDLPGDIGTFDLVISNPPFGKVAKIRGPRYSGESELAVVDIASQLGRLGAFILPQMSCPFQMSGRQYYERRPSEKFERFHRATGIDLECESIDCSYSGYAEGWKGVHPIVEFATADFEQLREEQAAPAPRAPMPAIFADLPLFAAAA